MANIISPIGYSLGKVHSGMLAYLCDLHREGTTGPLQSLFRTLNVPIPKCPRPAREWNRIDLAIFDGDNAEPRILVEMKVDDHDHQTTRWVAGEKRTDFQTVLYPEAHPDCDAYLYITLGMGDYFHRPFGSRFRWVHLREFAAAVDQVRTNDHVIEDWKIAIRNEVDLQERVRRNDRSRLGDYRTGAWNIYFLGQLYEKFNAVVPDGLLDIDPECYTCGTAPDTILDFGWSKEPEYLEINNNGRLNLKVSFAENAGDQAKQCDLARIAKRVRGIYRLGTYELCEGSRIGRSKTVATFDIGLSVVDGLFEFSRSQEETLQSLREVLEAFYGPPAARHRETASR